MQESVPAQCAVGLKRDVAQWWCLVLCVMEQSVDKRLVQLADLRKQLDSAFKQLEAIEARTLRKHMRVHISILKQEPQVGCGTTSFPGVQIEPENRFASIVAIALSRRSAETVGR